MIQLSLAFIVFFIVAVVHLLLCRQFDKKSHFGILIFIFLMGYIVLWLILSATVLLHFSDEYKYTAKLTYILLILLYSFFFRLANQVTPCQVIVKALENQSKKNLNDLIPVIGREDFISKGLQSLAKERYVRKIDNKYYLTWKGKLLALSSSLDKKVLIRSSERI